MHIPETESLVVSVLWVGLLTATLPHARPQWSSRTEPTRCQAFLGPVFTATFYRLTEASTKWPKICKRYFQIHTLYSWSLNSDQKSTKSCSYGSSWPSVGNGTGEKWLGSEHHPNQSMTPYFVDISSCVNHLTKQSVFLLVTPSTFCCRLLSISPWQEEIYILLYSLPDECLQ